MYSKQSDMIECMYLYVCTCTLYVCVLLFCVAEISISFPITSKCVYHAYRVFSLPACKRLYRYKILW